MVINRMPPTTVGACDVVPVSPTRSQQVVVVDGSAELMEELETELDAGQYDIVLVESTEHAYSQIRRAQPDLVILCVDLDEPTAFHVLSMLKLDAETRHIAILTYPLDGPKPDCRDPEELDAASEIFARPQVPVMN